MKSPLTPLFLAGALIAGCADSASEPDGAEDGRDDTFTAGGKTDTGGIAEGSPEALAVLRLANTASEEILLDPDHGMGLSALVVTNLIGFRAGDDGIAGTSDDGLFDTLQELDAVPFVGPNVFAKLLAFTRWDAGLSPFAGLLGSLRVLVDRTSCSSETSCTTSRVELDFSCGVAYRGVWCDTAFGHPLIADNGSFRISEIDFTSHLQISGAVARQGDGLAITLDSYRKTVLRNDFLVELELKSVGPATAPLQPQQNACLKNNRPTPIEASLHSGRTLTWPGLGILQVTAGETVDPWIRVLLEQRALAFVPGCW